MHKAGNVLDSDEEVAKRWKLCEDEILQKNNIEPEGALDEDEFGKPVLKKGIVMIRK